MEQRRCLCHGGFCESLRFRYGTPWQLTETVARPFGRVGWAMAVAGVAFWLTPVAVVRMVSIGGTLQGSAGFCRSWAGHGLLSPMELNVPCVPIVTVQPFQLCM